MPPSRRSYWLGLAILAYVCFGALESASSPTTPLFTLGALAVLLAEVWRRTARSGPTDHRLEASAITGLRACFWGAAVWIAARTGAPGRPALDAAANLGAGTAAVGALAALARIPTFGGLLVPQPSARSLDAAGFAALLWGIAVAIPATRAFFDSTDLLLDPLAIDYATTTASVGTLLVLIAATWRLKLQRRLEMGVGDRASGALALSLTAFFVAIPAATADIAPPDRVVPVAVIGASIACAWVATTREPTQVSTALRGVLAVMILGVPTTLLIAVAAREAPSRAGAIALIGCCVSIAVGLVARAVARPLGPEQSRWLDAIDRAARGALQPEPHAALRAALMALRGTASTPDARPELWRLDPPELLAVDIAGYLHTERAEAPARLIEIAMQEPERTLRAETLRALEVRRPDVRPLVAWFDTHNAFSATLVVDEDGPIGFILLPRGKRKNPMTLEEARAARLLADRLSALLAVSSALARARERHLEAERRAERLESERQRLEAIVVFGARRFRVHAELLARPVQHSAYSPAARLALDATERLGRTSTSLSFEVPRGVDPIGWAAVAHLSSSRCEGPFVVVDATRAAFHDPRCWEDDASSPVVLADGGTLAVLDAPALPSPAQEALARALARRAPLASGSLVDAPGLVLTARDGIGRLVECGRLVKSLASMVKESEVILPTLAERAEDLRALILDRLAAIGLSSRTEPLGIDPAALKLLIEHTWPGNDIELTDVLNRASAVAEGPVVTAADLAVIGFRPVADVAPLPTPLPSPSRRRPRAGSGARRR